ncbi:hypothetical protein BGZ63DRAFT_366521 [Mariannaea sp. PMI_226]|nr:hypothetical protein BGZ63DRAFT_366521 [Mariannaea sp. PMI_226]
MAQDLHEEENASASDDAEDRLEHEDEEVNEEDDSEAEDEDNHGLLDTMAAEGDESEEDSDDHSDDDSSLSGFSRLPLELRHRIWELFCPALTMPSRMFEFQLSRGPRDIEDFSDPNFRQSWLLQDGITLSDHTKPIRTVLAVNRASRKLALRQFPHALDLDAGPEGDGIVRFHRDKDIINLNGSLTNIGPEDQLSLSNLPEHVKNIVIGGWEDKDAFDPDGLARLVAHFPNLQTLFLCMSGNDCRKSKLNWCKSDMVVQYSVETYEKEPGLGEDLEFIFCFPDHQNHPDFARFQIPEDLLGEIPIPLERTLERMNVKAWPMVLFELESGISKYKSLPEYIPIPNPQNENSDDSGSEDENEEEDEEGTDLDEYESDGIDDAPILEEYGSDDEDEISIDGQDDTRGGSQSDSDAPEARFSSPEADPVNRTRKRRVIEDSDDEDNAEPDQPAAKRARTSRTVTSDSESDDEDAKHSPAAVNQENNESATEDGSEDEEEDESESDNEEEEVATRPTLAERLSAHRREHPVDSEDEDEDGDGDDGSEVDSDDDEDDDDDDESDDPSENALFADMAEEESEEDEVEQYPEYDAF